MDPRDSAVAVKKLDTHDSDTLIPFSFHEIDGLRKRISQETRVRIKE